MKLYKDQLIVVTGGAGFIGSGVIRHLNDQGYSNLILVDDLKSSVKWKNLVNKKFLDFISKDQLFDWLPGREHEIEAFIHLGACSDTMEVNASYLLENNYRYTVRLAEFALKHSIRFIYASSAATYGDGNKGFVDDEQHIYSLSPLNMYGYSKQLFDQWALNQGVFHKIVGLKYFNVFGPNEYHKGRMASAVVRMVDQIQQGENIKVFKSNAPDHYADGEQKRDFIYVKDAVRMTIQFLKNDVGGLFNVGSGQASTWNELAKAVYKALGVSPAIEYVEMPKELEKSYQNYSCASMQKTKRILKNDAKCLPLEDAVKEYVGYLLRNEIW